MNDAPETLSPGEATPASVSWYRLGPSAAAVLLESDLLRGLDHVEAVARQARFGENTLKERGGRSSWRLLSDQFASTLVIVLLIAAAVSVVVGSLKDAIAILAIVLLNGALGFIQEFRAERAIAALRRLAVPKVRVRRDGVVGEIPSSGLVPGDLVLLEAGNLVPADGRIVEAASLSVQEAVLTGESGAVEKRSTQIPGEGALSPGDQVNMAFMGTSVVYGRGQMMVTATGMVTELGRVADLLQGIESVTTPLQRRLNRLGKVLAVAALVVVAAIFGFGLLIGEDWQLMLMTSVSMAVAVIPEGLPAVVTIALALGAQRMLRRRALIRRLPAVETLGSVTVICSDKTGTLTENRMTVAAIDLAGHRLEISEELSHRMPVTTIGEGAAAIIRQEPSLALLLMGGALCSDAVLKPAAARPGHFRSVGDPTEGALVIAAARYGLLKDRLDAAYPRVAEVPFDSDRKRMTTVHRIADCTAWIGACAGLDPGATLVFMKGAVDSLLTVCTHVWDDGRPIPIDEGLRQRITGADDELARGGMRVLGIAFRLIHGGAPHEGLAPERLEADLIFIGLVGMLDPPRPEVKQAVATCRSAGIRPVMITGDHPVTARRIARDLGILFEGQVITGSELQHLTPAELDLLSESVSVYARVAPEQKLRIVESLQRRGQVVAMTGDGVNDAPALRRADIGVAMGITGTDVSKEAAAMVLLDDNFTTIIAAVEEGRAINDNIRRFLKFSLAGNLGKVLLVFVCPLLGMPLPLLPFQILWLNLVTDGALGLGIGVEAAEPGTMQRPPQSPSAGILTRGLWVQILWIGALLGIVNLSVAYWAFTSNQPGWQTIVMTTVMLLQIAEAHVSRSSKVPVIRLNPLSNRALFFITLLIVVLQAIVIYTPALHGLFGTEPLSARQLIVPLSAGLIVLIIVEIAKRFGGFGGRRHLKREGE
jgi:P-type Ca2+ transporter type 2C